MAPLPEGVEVVYHRAQGCMAKITLSELKEPKGYKEPALVEGFEGHERKD
jgi:hypothetical protein